MRATGFVGGLYHYSGNRFLCWNGIARCHKCSPTCRNARCNAAAFWRRYHQLHPCAHKAREIVSWKARVQCVVDCGHQRVHSDVHECATRPYYAGVCAGRKRNCPGDLRGSRAWNCAHDTRCDCWICAGAWPGGCSVRAVAHTFLTASRWACHQRKQERKRASRKRMPVKTGTRTQAPHGNATNAQTTCFSSAETLSATSTHVRPSRHVTRSPAPRSHAPRSPQARSHIQQTQATPPSAFCFCAANEVQQVPSQSKCRSCTPRAQC